MDTAGVYLLECWHRRVAIPLANMVRGVTIKMPRGSRFPRIRGDRLFFFVMGVINYMVPPHTRG